MSFRFINYAYCYLVGSFLKIGGVKSAYGKELTGAEIYVTMLTILMGVSTMGFVSFYAQMVMKAAGSSTVLFNIIDAPTSVEIEPERQGMKVNTKTFQGEY